MRNVVEHVEAGDPLRGQQPRRLGVGLLQNGRADVAGLHFLALRALHVQHRGLQHAAERRGLLRVVLVSAPHLLDRVVEIGVQIAPQAGEIGAAGAQNPFAVDIVRQRIEQMLERQVGVPARDRFAVRDGEHQFEGRGKQGGSYASSTVARSGKPAPRARVVTVSTLVSATSQGYTPATPRPFT